METICVNVQGVREGENDAPCCPLRPTHLSQAHPWPARYQFAFVRCVAVAVQQCLFSRLGGIWECGWRVPQELGESGSRKVGGIENLGMQNLLGMEETRPGSTLE